MNYIIMNKNLINDFEGIDPMRKEKFKHFSNSHLYKDLDFRKKVFFFYPSLT